MFRNHGNYATNFVRAKAPVLGRVETVEPDFDRCFAAIDMDVRRFIGFVAVEVKAAAVLAVDGGHLSWSPCRTPSERGHGIPCPRVGATPPPYPP